jgi:hypothetical protein
MASLVEPEFSLLLAPEACRRPTNLKCAGADSRASCASPQTIEKAQGLAKDAAPLQFGG